MDKRPVLAELARRLPTASSWGCWPCSSRSSRGADRRARRDPSGHAGRLPHAEHAILGLSVPGFWNATCASCSPRSGGLEPSDPVHRLSVIRGPTSPFLLPASSSASPPPRRSCASPAARPRGAPRTTCAPRGPRGCASACGGQAQPQERPDPVITILGIQIAQILGGTVIASIFGSRHGPLPLRRDQPARLSVIQGVNLLIVRGVLTNLIVDAFYAFLDPRIRSRTMQSNPIEVAPWATGYTKEQRVAQPPRGVLTALGLSPGASR